MTCLDQQIPRVVWLTVSQPRLGNRRGARTSRVPSKDYVFRHLGPQLFIALPQGATDPVLYTQMPPATRCIDKLRRLLLSKWLILCAGTSLQTLSLNGLIFSKPSWRIVDRAAGYVINQGRTPGPLSALTHAGLLHIVQTETYCIALPDWALILCSYRA